VSCPAETTGTASSPRPLRAWQRAALSRYLATAPQDFLAVATPGAGKTAFALRVAAELLAQRTVHAVTVVTPTEHLKYQWATAAAEAGLAIDPDFRNGVGATSRDYHGAALTYAQVAAQPGLHRARTQAHRTLVIFDEIHHAGHAKSWGEGIREAFTPALRRLSLTGTPFRSDDTPIPFVTYEPDSAGVLRSTADYCYGYSQALADGVVRPVMFLAYSGQARWRTSAGEEYSARLGEPLTAEHTARAWRTALDPQGEWIPAVLTAADTRLAQLRAGGLPDAAGLVIATDHPAARAYAGILRRITGRQPVLVLSDDPSASSRIAAFAGSAEPWLVAVRMVSEGVDVPRLAVGVYATSAATPLYFAQAVGRFVRARQPGETATVFLPSVPVLLRLASELEKQRDHVLGAPQRGQPGWEDTALTQPDLRHEQPGQLQPGFTALEASAELDQVIYDGACFGPPRFATSEDEQEYLGLPGLLEPEQMRALLRLRQQQQLPQASAGAAVAARPPSRTVAERLAELRRELNALVALTHHRTGAPHAVIHHEIRLACGGPPTAMATAEQLKRRIAYLRSR
jgi:superfamily II DNA or RNA helicase